MTPLVSALSRSNGADTFNRWGGVPMAAQTGNGEPRGIEGMEIPP
jgi:hypothetical protein